MRFDFDFRASEGARRRERGPVRRLLVLGDLRGDADDPADRLADRPITKVDVDNVDAVLARHAPAIQLSATGGGERLEIRRVDDFHPDTLVDRLAVFQQLRGVRARLEHPSTFAGAVAELQADAAAPAVAPQGETRAGVEPDTSTLDRLLGRTGSRGVTPPPAAARPTFPPAVDALIRQAVAPHIVPAPSPQLPQMLAAVDAAMTDLMRAVLHDPAFQRVEASWRAVQWLVSVLELGEDLELHLLHVTREELAVAAAPDGDLRRRLVDRHTPAGEPFELSALIGNYRFGPAADDVATLESLGGLAAALGAPFIAEASAKLLGIDDLSAAPAPAAWPMLPADDDARWRALRTNPASARVGLALPRFLLRLPYGRRTDPITSFAFEEQPARPRHDAFLWGNAAFLYGVAIARVLDAEGDPSSAGTIDGLPTFASVIDDEMTLQPAAEVRVTERAFTAIRERGLMPVIAYGNGDAVRLGPPSSIADPPADLLG